MSGYFITPPRTTDTSADFAIMRADALAGVRKILIIVEQRPIIRRIRREKRIFMWTELTVKLTALLIIKFNDLVIAAIMTL